jgi:hypothetical protein
VQDCFGCWAFRFPFSCSCGRSVGCIDIGRSGRAIINTERAKYYERNAADARAKSEAITELEDRETMVKVAQMWEFLARSAQSSSLPAKN